jgi:hypothetical protein
VRSVYVISDLHLGGDYPEPREPGKRGFRLCTHADAIAQFIDGLAYALPYRRFVEVLANCNARLGADVVRYAFIVSDFHRLLLAGLPAHFESDMPSHGVGLRDGQGEIR